VRMMRVFGAFVAVALGSVVLAVVTPSGPAAAAEPTAIVPTGVANAVRALSCPTADVCWSVGQVAGSNPGATVGVLQRIAGGTPEAPTPLPVGDGESALAQGIDCWTATDCVVLLRHQPAGDQPSFLAASWVTGGVASAPTPVPVGAPATSAFGPVSCSGSTCVAAVIDDHGPLFTLPTSHLVGLSPDVAPAVLATRAEAVVTDLDCPGPASCVVVGFGGDLFAPVGFAARLTGGSLVDFITTSAYSPANIVCDTLTSCVYQSQETGLDGRIVVGRITAGGVQPPIPVPDVLVVADLACGATVDACAAVGFVNPGVTPQGRIVDIEDGVPAPATPIEEVAAVLATSCGPATCSAIGYTELDPELGLQPENARLLTGIALPGVVVQVPTQLEVDPVFLKVRGGVPIVTLGTLRARLTTTTGEPLAGKVVTFAGGGTPVCTATTGADGQASCRPNITGLLLVLTSGGVTASFAGDAGALPSNGAAGYVG
jgi:hypothetical protein